MTLVLEDLEVKAVEQEEKSGDRVRMEILEFIAGPEIRPEDIRLDVPAGTLEVHPLGGKKAGKKR